MDVIAAENEEYAVENEVRSSDRFPQFQYSIIAGLSGVVIGTAIGWNSPATELLSAKDDEAVIANGDPVVWKAAGHYCLGAAFGGLIQRPLAKWMGYRWSTVAYDAVALIGWLVLLGADFGWPYCVALGRIVQGIGTGGLGLLTPTYISHITDVDVRGRAQMFHQAFVYFGIFYAYIFGTNTTYAMLITLCTIWPVFHLIITVLFLPESPCFLYTRNDDEMVRTVICQIKGAQSDVHSDFKELKKYMGSFESSCCDFVSMNTTAILKKCSCNVFIIGVGLMMFHQLCGINLCIFYMEHMFKEFGSMDDTSLKTRFLIVAMSLVQIVLCLISIELVEFFGRKCMLITSALGMCFSMSMIYYVISTQEIVYDEIEWRNNKVIILVILYVCSYSIGWGPVIILLYTEIVHFKKWYSSLIYAGGQLVIFVMIYTFSHTQVLTSTYLLCTSISLSIVSIIFVYYFVPETRGLHLNQIQTVLNNRVREKDDLCFQEVKVYK